MRKMKKLTSVFFAVIMVLGVLTVAQFTASAVSYKDGFISALLKNESECLNNYVYDFYFYDLNFDNKPELIVNYISSSSATDLYFYENGSIKLAKHQYKNNTGEIVADNFFNSTTANIQDDAYYNPKENKYIVHSGYFSQDGEKVYFADGELTFNGNTATTYCYALRTLVGSVNYYYDGSNGYKSTQYANKITESQYKTITKNRFNNYYNLNVKLKKYHIKIGKTIHILKRKKRLKIPTMLFHIQSTVLLQSS